MNGRDLFPNQAEAFRDGDTATSRAIAKMVQPPWSERLLGELLTAIFSDDGQMQRSVGTTLAVSKAIHDILEMRSALDEARIAYCNLHVEMAEALDTAKSGRITEALDAITAALSTQHA